MTRVKVELPDPLPPGLYMTEDHQYFLNGEGPNPSVTTVLKVIDLPAIGVFKAKEAARAVYRALGPADSASDMTLDMAEDQWIKWALLEADNARDQAAELGTSVHLLADLAGASESDPTGWQVSSDTYPYLNAYRDFLGRYGRSSIVSSEKAVWSLNGYAGTYDLMMQLPIEGVDSPAAMQGDPLTELWLIDIKTSGKGPYPEWGLQLAGYRWADYIVLPGDPKTYPMPQIQRTGVLHLQPDLYPDTGWRLIEYPTTYEKDYLTFLAALEIWRWRKEGRFLKSRLNIPKPQPPKTESVLPA